MTVTVEGIGVFCALVLAIAGVVGLGARVVLLPWLRTQIADPLTKKIDAVAGQVKTIHHEVTPNGGGSIKDSVRRLEAGQARTEEKLAQLDADQTDHEQRQSAETAKLGESVEYVRRRLDEHLTK